VAAIGVIGNGGHYYWYQGKNGQETLRAADAFERLGLHAAAQAMRQSLLVFPGGAPPPNPHDCQTYLEDHGNELEKAFEQLDPIVWKAEFYPAAIRYISLRRAELIVADPGLAAFLPLQ
jgi:hypothetical protein